MRISMFGDVIIESAEDDLGSVETLQDAGTSIYAIVRLDDTSGLYDFEVMRNDDGRGVVSSDPIFETSQDAAAYLDGWVEDIQYD
jgi:hypothetical protein